MIILMIGQDSVQGSGAQGGIFSAKAPWLPPGQENRLIKGKGEKKMGSQNKQDHKEQQNKDKGEIPMVIKYSTINYAVLGA